MAGPSTLLPDRALLAAQQFAPLATSLQRLGDGHIHDTFLVATPGGFFVLQRLNTGVFPEPELLIRNHQQAFQALAAQPELPLRLPELRSTPAGAFLVQDEWGDYWRALRYLAGTFAVEATPSLAQIEAAAAAVGHFLGGLQALAPTALQAALPGFHDSWHRWGPFVEVVAANPHGRNVAAQDLIAFLEAESPLFAAVEKNNLPLRVVHADPKLGNVLFDQQTGQAVALLDWDTLMPGVIPTDFGDMVRAMAASAPEDEADLDRVAIDPRAFQAIVTGFLPPLRRYLTPAEIDYLFTGAQWIILEQCLRFLHDYLAGDRYYKIAYPEHNLVRARNQQKLYQSLIAQAPTLQALIARI